MRTIAKHTSLVGIAAIIFTAACSEPVAPIGSTTITTDSYVPPSEGAGPSVTPARISIYSGLDADTALHAEAQRQLRSGNTRLTQFLDTAAGWSASRFRAMHALASAPQLPGVTSDISGDGEPGDFNLGMLQQPMIYYSNTYVAINTHWAAAATTQFFTNATDGRSDMTYDVVGPNGAEIPQTTTAFFGVGGLLYQCVDDHLHNRPNPDCNVQGTVQGYVSINLAVGCGETVSASAAHNAWAAVPFPDVTRSEKGWSAKFGLVHGADANPRADGRVSASNAPCEPPHIETRRISADGGDAGGMQITMTERQTNTECFAIQDRTVQGDGFVGPWVTISVECYSSSYGSKAAGESTTAKTTGLAFTLVGLQTGETGQIIRRGTAHQASEPDAIAIDINEATPRDIASAVAQLSSLTKKERQLTDAVSPLRRASGTNVDARLLSAYATLLSNLKAGREAMVAGIGNARTVPVIVLP